MYNLEKKQTEKGWGVFAAENIPSRRLILEFSGEILTSSQIPFPLPLDDDHYLQVGVDTFLGPTNDIDNLVNHSCEPNCAVYIFEQQALLCSIAAIQKDTELVFDYSTTSTDSKDIWMLPCQCGSPICRKEISGFQYLDDATKRKYKRLRIVPPYVLKVEKKPLVAPHPNAQAHKKFIEELKQMTSQEIVESARRAGIYDEEGNLTPEYGGKPK